MQDSQAYALFSLINIISKICTDIYNFEQQDDQFRRVFS